MEAEADVMELPSEVERHQKNSSTGNRCDFMYGISGSFSPSNPGSIIRVSRNCPIALEHISKAGILDSIGQRCFKQGDAS